MYNAYITRIKNLHRHPNADRLQIGECFGNAVIVSMEYEDNQLGVYFPSDGQLSVEFADANTPASGPAFYRGELVIKGSPKDTFIRLDGFTKGFVSVNGKNIGRYFNPAGPQKTLYVPAPFLKSGINEIIVFESDKTDSLTVTFTDKPELG